MFPRNAACLLEWPVSGQPAEEDLELVERVRQGDLEAFNVIVSTYQQRVYSLCLRMVGSPQAAEDATQDAFISAYKGIGRQRGGSVQSWLFRIAANACIDELRRRKRRPQVSLDMPAADETGSAFDLPDPEAGPERRALQSEIGAALQAELLRLPADQRLVVTLRDVEGLSYEEIAVTINGSVGTVKSRISRGRARLRVALRARPELFGDLVRHTGES